MSRTGSAPTAVAWFVSLSFFACASGFFAPESAIAPSRSQPVTLLNQGWSPADWEWWYHFSQGSAAVPYDIFLHLQVADDPELFRSGANSERYGLIPAPGNPGIDSDGLPISLTNTVIVDPKWKAEGIGATCAPCHEGQLTYKGKQIRVRAGVGNTFDMMECVHVLAAAVQAKLHDACRAPRNIKYDLCRRHSTGYSSRLARSAASAFVLSVSKQNLELAC